MGKEIVPAGWYNAECLNAEIITSKKETRGCKLTWQILEEGEQQGKEFTDVLWFTKPARGRMHWAEDAMGLESGLIEKTDPENLVGCVARVEVKEGSWTNRDGEEIPCNEVAYEGYQRLRTDEKKPVEDADAVQHKEVDFTSEDIPF